MGIFSWNKPHKQIFKNIKTLVEKFGPGQRSSRRSVLRRRGRLPWLPALGPAAIDTGGGRRTWDTLSGRIPPSWKMKTKRNDTSPKSQKWNIFKESIFYWTIWTSLKVFPSKSHWKLWEVRHRDWGRGPSPGPRFCPVGLSDLLQTRWPTCAFWSCLYRW